MQSSNNVITNTEVSLLDLSFGSSELFLQVTLMTPNEWGFFSYRPILPTPQMLTGCVTIPFNSDTHYPDLPQSLQVKGSVPLQTQVANPRLPPVLLTSGL